jgi:hypothetical protein
MVHDDKSQDIFHMTMNHLTTLVVVFVHLLQIPQQAVPIVPIPNDTIPYRNHNRGGCCFPHLE